MRTRHLGSSGPHVSALGLGCSGMLDAGVTLLDTADFYGMATTSC